MQRSGFLHDDEQFVHVASVCSSTKNRQNYLISFQYFLYYNKLYKWLVSKQRCSQLAGSVTINVAKLSFASELMQAAERAHNFVIDFCFQTISTVVEVLRCWSPFRSLLSRLVHQTLTQMRCPTVVIHRRWYWSLWASTTLAAESPTDLFVASHWLERSSCRLPITLLVVSRAVHSTSQILTTFYLVFISTFTEGLLQKPPSSSDLPLIGPRLWHHTPRLIVMHIVFRSLLKIFVYAAKQTCKLL